MSLGRPYSHDLTALSGNRQLRYLIVRCSAGHDPDA